MTRAVAALAAFCLLATPALAKDLCVGIDGYAPGTTVLLKNVKGRGTLGPVSGYINHPDPVGGGARLSPVSGTALTSSDGVLVAGLTWHEVALYPNGATNVLNDLFAIHLACEPGADGKLAEGDGCDTYIVSSFRTGQVISCKTVAPIP